VTGWSHVRRALSRRDVLAMAGILATAGLAASDDVQPSSGPAAVQPQARTKPRQPTAPKPRATPSPAPSQSRPITTLAGYRKLVPGPAFSGNAVALTIDDGPHPVWTPKVLNLLERYHVPATFCLIGNQVRGHEALARSVVAAGHHVANHTWSHPLRLPALTPPQMHREIEWAQDKIYSTTGYAPRLFRSPGGSWSPSLLAQAAQAGLTALDWSDDPKDWQRPGVAAITNRLLAAKPGQILLCHDGGGDRSQTYQALQQVIPALLARGYTFVSL
jgi:peptidoglycan-N-acetylglucosamine deacetylase